EVDLGSLPSDSGLRPQISSYGSKNDEVRRAYLQKGPCQPRDHDFPQSLIGEKMRRFNKVLFNKYFTRLEYSITDDAAYCLYCYLFNPSGKTFVNIGFTEKIKKKFNTHVGAHSSAHNKARRNCEALMNQKQHIHTIICRQSYRARQEYRTRLNASVDCVRFLLRQGMTFRQNDEYENSKNQGNFLELLKFLGNHNEDIDNVTLCNAPENQHMTAPKIQKDIVNASAIETTNAIIKELGNGLFSILVDEARDISSKEQMAVALRFVNREGCVIERFIGIVHVSSTTSLSLKMAIEALFSKYGLSLSSIRGQGYDGASNMQGEFGALKSLIIKENKSAHYIHYFLFYFSFAHQLQLALVSTAKNHVHVALLFNIVTNLLNIVGASCKRRDQLRDKHAERVLKALENNGLVTGKGLNQEIGFKCPGDTRWGSHYGTLINLIIIFPDIIGVLDIITVDGSNSEHRGEACALMEALQCFDFVFCLHLMHDTLGITNELSQALQRKEQDFVNAMRLVNISKQRLKDMRENFWDSLLDEVSLFCNKQNIIVPKMDDMWVPRGRSRRRVQGLTNSNYYHIEVFYTVIDMQLLELNDRFTEVNTKLLLCMACLNLINHFFLFNTGDLVSFIKFYPNDFSTADLIELKNQLETYIIDMRSDIEFTEVNDIGELAKRMKEKNKDKLYPLVYMLLKLALILLVSTYTVEKAFSAMPVIKNRLRNQMGDQWMNDISVTYIEKDIFNVIDNEAIIQWFQNMKTRRTLL
ncbi:LOW QUALITY PROTEIN: Dimer_Tnp_hAT domain-containing protein/DUF4371 domain-containing protein, partial [Cephalotus follicularis]